MPCTGRVAITCATAVNLAGQWMVRGALSDGWMNEHAYLAEGVWVDMY